MVDVNRARWRKSTYSGQARECVEVADNLAIESGLVGVRDSKLGATSPILTLSTSEWRALVAAIHTDTRH